MFVIIGRHAATVKSLLQVPQRPLLPTHLARRQPSTLLNAANCIAE
jgi:hypothetical protein